MASSNVFLVPHEPTIFERTVEYPVDLSEFSERPDELQGLDRARLCGHPDESNTRTYFEQMTGDDLLLFFRDDRYVAAGVVGTAFEDVDGWVGETFWGGEDAPLVYTVEEFEPISVSPDKLNTVFDYGEDYAPSGLMRVADGRVTNQTKAIKLAVETVSTG